MTGFLEFIDAAIARADRGTQTVPHHCAAVSGECAPSGFSRLFSACLIPLGLGDLLGDHGPGPFPADWDDVRSIRSRRWPRAPRYQAML